jgi:hypothetical protein
MSIYLQLKVIQIQEQVKAHLAIQRQEKTKTRGDPQTTNQQLREKTRGELENLIIEIDNNADGLHMMSLWLTLAAVFTGGMVMGIAGIAITAPGWWAGVITTGFGTWHYANQSTILIENLKTEITQLAFHEDDNDFNASLADILSFAGQLKVTLH